MRRRDSIKIAVVLILSLILAGHYVEYGRQVQASATETGAKDWEMEWESEGESESETETESERETESEWETESETETESEGEIWTETGTETDSQWESESATEPELETETESESESASELETEAVSEAEGESEPESEPETETESESGNASELETEAASEAEGESEPESEPETETESESENASELETESETVAPETESEEETEQMPQVIYIESIRVKVPEGGRVYDGTKRIDLDYEIRLPQDAPEELRKAIVCEASLESGDAGMQGVSYRFLLPGELQEQYVLEVEPALLEAEVKPRPLAVKLPDGWKIYGSKAAISQVHLTGEVEVKGFVKDAQGKPVIPEGFQAPQVKLDTDVAGRWSHMYQGGTQKVYRDAIVLKYAKDGKPTGNPTANYYFDTDPSRGNYQKGSLTIVPAPIQEGIDYDVYGESLYRDESGNLWVRAGTGLSIVPREGSGYNQGVDYGPVTESGTFTFTLKKVDGEGAVLASSLEGQLLVLTDGEVPQASFEIAGARQEGEYYYGKPGVWVTIQIPRDEQSGMKSAGYFVSAHTGEAPEKEGGENWWNDCRDGEALALKEEGTYEIYVRTEDHAGNLAYARSASIVIDGQGPELKISGVSDRSANDGAVQITVSSSDPNYRQGSLEIEMEGAKGGGSPRELSREEDEKGASAVFSDFPRTLQWDDSYVLTAKASDLAGNETRTRISFSVNRFGSVYDLAEETKAALAEFYHTAPFPVVFLETNVDYVGEAQILCLKNGEAQALVQGRDYTARLQAEVNRKQYRYTVAPEVFVEDGAYEVILTSRDRASNSSDSLAQQKMVRFFIDSTPPQCLITGVSNGEICQAQELWLCLEARDNGALESLEVYVDGVMAASRTGDQMAEQGGVIKWRVSEKDDWQRIQARVRDQAGNESWTEELHFYVTQAQDTGEIEPFKPTEKTARELVSQQETESGIQEEASFSQDQAEQGTGLGQREESAEEAGEEEIETKKISARIPSPWSAAAAAGGAAACGAMIWRAGSGLKRKGKKKKRMKN